MLVWRRRLSLANAKDEWGDQVLYLYDDRSGNRSSDTIMVDLNKQFDREVWQELCKARTCVEKASFDAGKLGHIDLAVSIDNTVRLIMQLQAKCSEISNT